MTEAGHDARTTAYFDRGQRQWSPGRYRQALSLLQDRATPETRLIDIGCGRGNILQLIREQSVIEDVTGLDTSENSLQAVRDSLGCATIAGSILDTAVVQRHAGHYDIALMGDVLHHLVGHSRRSSRRLARQALANALALLRDGGALFILEPLFEPGWAVAAIFYVKVVGAALFPDRRELLGRRWANVGAPVVHFYSEAHLRRLIAQTDDAVLIDGAVTPRRRIGPGLGHSRMTLLVQKQAL